MIGGVFWVTPEILVFRAQLSTSDTKFLGGKKKQKSSLKEDDIVLYLKLFLPSISRVLYCIQLNMSRHF